jgi:hypothetical protein
MHENTWSNAVPAKNGASYRTRCCDFLQGLTTSSDLVKNGLIKIKHLQFLKSKIKVHMKKAAIIIALITGFYTASAQEEEKSNDEKKGGFKKENMFVGGNVNLGFSNSSTVLGISPYLGYSLNKYLDVAFSTNFSYTSVRDYNEYGDKIRQTLYGPGAFVRVYPFRFVFAQVQYEYNLINYRYIPAKNSINYLPSREHLNASSFLIGGGYAGGREGTGSNFYYFSVMWDVSKSKNSPYVDELKRALPIIRAGYNIALFQGRN